MWLRVGPRLPASVDPTPILAGGAAAGAEAFDDFDLAVIIEVRPGRDLIGGTPTTEAITGFGIKVAYPDARRGKVESIVHGPAAPSSPLAPRQQALGDAGLSSRARKPAVAAFRRGNMS